MQAPIRLRRDIARLRLGLRDNDVQLLRLAARAGVAIEHATPCSHDGYGGCMLRCWFERTSDPSIPSALTSSPWILPPSAVVGFSE